MITVEDFKNYFKRDFKASFLPNDIEESSDEATEYILDSDIEKAINQKTAILNEALFEDCKILYIAEMFLTAHCLVYDLRTSNSGLASTFEFPLQSKSVGGVSVSYGIPQIYLQKEIFSFFLTSGYGLKYLALLVPRMKGNVSIATGWTLP